MRIVKWTEQTLLIAHFENASQRSISPPEILQLVF